MSMGHMLQPMPQILSHRPFLQGDWRVDIAVSWANIWNQDREAGYIVDGEWIYTSLGVTRRLNALTSAGMEIPVVGRTGGFADHSIEDFHQAFDFDDAHRSEYPRNRVLVEYPDRHGDTRRVEGDAWGVGDVRFFVVRQLMSCTRRRPSVGAQLTLSLPTGDEDELQGTGAIGVGAGLSLAQRLWSDQWRGYALAHYSYIGSDDMAGVPIRRSQFTGIVAVEYLATPRTSLLVQWLASSGLARNAGDFSDPIYELSAGWKHRVGRRSVLECALVENTFSYDNSMDFGMHLNWTFFF